MKNYIEKNNENEFDDYAQNYDQRIGPLIKLTGEGREYFALNRVKWLAKRLQLLGHKSNKIVDYGCGTGIAIKYLLELLKPNEIIGVDPSNESLQFAQKEISSEKVSYKLLNAYQPSGDADLVFCNGVLHHIPPGKRKNNIDIIHRALAIGGFFALWEFNTYNPLTRLGMALSPVDKNAVPISCLEAKKLLVTAGFELLLCDFVFYFPRMFKLLRKYEHRLSKLPFGAQYLWLAKKRREAIHIFCRLGKCH